MAMAKPAPLASNVLSPGAEDSDLLNPKVSASALDFLLIELVPLAQRTAEHLHAREQRLRDAYAQSKLLHEKPGSSGGEVNGTAGTKQSEGSSGGKGGGAEEDAQVREAVVWRLDGLGYRVGQGLVERFSANKPRPQTALDAIKFICKDLWQLVFRKQIDNLKTNHRGVFVLTDTRFQPLSRMSVDRRAGPKAAEEAVSRAQYYLYFPAGIIRGALAGLGIEATVAADSTELPTATFQIKTKGAKA